MVLSYYNDKKRTYTKICRIRPNDHEIARGPSPAVVSSQHQESISCKTACMVLRSSFYHQLTLKRLELKYLIDMTECHASERLRANKPGFKAKESLFCRYVWAKARIRENYYSM